MIKDSRAYEIQIIEAVRSVNRALGGSYGRSSAVYKSEFNQYEVQLIDAIRAIGRTLSSSGLSLAGALNGEGGIDLSVLDKYVTLATAQVIDGLKTFRNAGGIKISNGSTVGSLYVDSDGILHSDLPFVSDSFISSYNSGGGGASGEGIDFDTLKDMIIGGTDISVTPDTTAQTLTIAFTGSGGSGGGGDTNVIETVKVNGAALTPDASKAVDILIRQGTANGTIRVNGANVAVKGLKTAAYADSSSFDAAGAAAAVLGSSGDTSSTKTVYGAFAKIDEIMASAGAGEMNVIDEVQVNGTAVTPTGKSVNLTVAESQTNGKINVQGKDIPIHGLGTAAFTDIGNYMPYGAVVDAAHKLQNSNNQDYAIGSSIAPVYFSGGIPVACDLTDKYVTLDTLQVVTGKKTFRNANGISIANADGSVTGTLYIDSNGALHVNVPIVSEGYISSFGASGNTDSLEARVTQLESTIASLEARIAALENNS